MTTPTPRVRLYPANSWQMTLNLLQAGQEAAVVLGAIKGVAGDPGDPSTFGAAWRDQAWAAFRPLITNDVSCTGATLRATGVASGMVYELGPAVNPAGAAAGSTPIAGACTLIKWATATGGRSGKGRTYLPGLPAAAVATGGRTYVAGHQTSVSTAVTAYLGANVFSGDLDPAVLSFTKGTAYVITSGAISPVIGLQRRRMR